MDETALCPIVKKSLSDSALELLSRYIDQMLLAGETKLPSEVELSKTLSVSRTTIRRALSFLENKGAIIRLHGRGTFINPNLSQMKVDLFSAHDYEQVIHKSGFSPTVSPVCQDVSPASPLQQSVLKLPPETQVLCLGRLYAADGEPSILCFNHIPLRPGEDAPEAGLEKPIFDLAYQLTGKICLSDSVEITAARGNETMAYTMGRDLLQCESVLIFDAVYYDSGNEPVFAAKTFFNTAYIKFHMVRSIKPQPEIR